MAFERAFAHLRRGTREPLERALLLDLRASLSTDQRRFEQAMRLLRRASAIFHDVGDEHRAGRSLIKMSGVHYFAGDPEAGIPLLREALRLIDPREEPRLLLAAWHNLAFYHAEAGRFMEAQGIYIKARPIYRRFPDPWTVNRQRWVQGKIACGLGLAADAEVHLLAARDGFLAEGVPYDTALVSLELACLYAEQGRVAELKRLAGQMLPVFSSRQIHREALAALSFLRQAVEAEQASAELVRRVASYLKRAERDPALRFELPPG
jgi:tetratricopeptide (TPR) repeat protein